MHHFGHNFDHDYYFELLDEEEWLLNQFLGVPLPQVRNHLSSFRSDQTQSGQRMLGPDVPRSLSTSRSGIIVEVTVIHVSYWIFSPSPKLLRFFPITRIVLPVA